MPVSAIFSVQSRNCRVDFVLIHFFVLPTSSEAGRAATHDFALADQLSVELRTVESEIDVEVDAVEGTLRCVHALEVLLEVLAAEIGGESDNLFDACRSRNVESALDF
jgi:hypothetical protein